MSKIITFMNQKGGPGKSTLALNLAHIFQAKFGYKVVIIDTDEDQLTCLTFKSDRAIHFNDELLKDLDPYFPEVVVISKNKPYRKQIAQLKSYYDYVFIDTKGEFGQFQMDLLRISDYVLSPVSPSKVDVAPSKIIIDAVNLENNQREEGAPIGMAYIMNKVSPSSNSVNYIRRMIIEEFNAKVMSANILLADATPSYLGIGLTSFDTSVNLKACNKMVNIDKIGKERVSLNPDKISKTFNELNSIAEELLGELK